MAITTITVAVRLPHDLHVALLEVAERRDDSLDFVIRQALHDFVEREREAARGAS